jgi:acetyl-CoA acetyltransferase
MDPSVAPLDCLPLYLYVLQFVDPHTGVASHVWLKHDDGIRKSSAHILSKLPAAFNKDGTTTAGNASQVTTARRVLF